MSPNTDARNKYNVSPSESRTLHGKVYPSKAEMLYAKALYDNRESGTVIEYIEQPRCVLGEDTVYHPDFFVVPNVSGNRWYGPEAEWVAGLGVTLLSGRKMVFYVDVKGVSTPSFNRSKKLWVKYARHCLYVVKFDYGKREFYTEVIVEPKRIYGN